MARRALDCVVIGYNETPFAEYETLLRRYGEDSEAYRDLRLSCLEVAGAEKLTYGGLLNHALGLARGDAGRDLFRSGDIPNLAAAYLTHYLRRRGLRAEYVNLFQYEKDLLADYLRAEPLCVAITTTFYVLNLPVSEIVRFVREHSRVPIVLGGPLVANHCRSYAGAELAAALRDTGADLFVHDGQGEQTLADLVRCLDAGGSLRSVPNLLYFEDDALCINDRVPENNSLDDDAIDWTSFGDRQLGPTIQTRTARSCAFSCSFCNYPTRAGALTLASLASIERELDSIQRLGGVRNVVFIDDTFNVPVNRFKQICRLLIAKRYGFNWFSYFRCSNADLECADLMAESGCKGVFLGIESGSPAILKNMNKAATVEKYARGIQWLRQRGILTFGSFITGFPGETAATVAETVDFIRGERPDYFRSQMWYCEPGTPILRERERYAIAGEGFVWRHQTMDSMEAMEHIERMFLVVRESEWLPQWSFDFWIIPYFLGKGVSLDRFRAFMQGANRLLALDVATVEPREKAALQRQHLESLAGLVQGWGLAG
jgi:radical SAM PhpK family P-methyltransferase